MYDEGDVLTYHVAAQWTATNMSMNNSCGEYHEIISRPLLSKRNTRGESVCEGETERERER